MGTQALRNEFDLEEDDRFFVFGVEQVERSRNTYEHQLRKRRVLVGLAIGIGSVGLVALIIGLAWGLGHRKLDYVCPRTYQPDQTDAVFFVIGDWGRQGNDNQRKVARLMADVSECMPPQFVISTGDNFYPSGLSSVSDPLFTQSFAAVYNAPGLQVPWYAVLGNHDYGDNVDVGLLNSGHCLAAPVNESQCSGKCCFSPWWQTLPDLTSRDWRWNATMGGVVTRKIPLGANSNMDVIFLDTTPLIYQYQSRQWASFLYGVNRQDGDSIKAQLQQALNASYTNANATNTKWRLVVGHHPIRSYGSHCAKAGSYDCRDMDFLQPWLARYRVAAYLNGHDHDQQLIKASDDPVHYVVSGAGSDIREGEFDEVDADVRSKDALFLSDTPGFLAVVMAGDTMRLHFYTTQQSGPTYTRSVPVPNW